MSDTNKESWNKHAQRFFTEDYLSLDDVDSDSFDYPTEKDLHIIGEVAGLRVLEIGAGSCNCGIALARKGATVTCSDISQAQIDIGKRVAEKAGVDIALACSDMTDLSFVNTGEMDLVISMSAISYVHDYNKVCAEVGRVLKQSGRFVFSVNHPFMMCVGATELWPEEQADSSYRYIGPVAFKWEQEDDFMFTTYRLRVSDYVNMLAANGMYITRMEELFSVTDDFEANEMAVRSRYPSVLVIAAVKNA